MVKEHYITCLQPPPLSFFLVQLLLPLIGRKKREEEYSYRRYTNTAAYNIFTHFADSGQALFI